MRGTIILFTLAFSLLFAKANAQTTSVTLNWTPSTSQNITGYYIYYGTSSGDYLGAVSVSNNVTSVTIRGLASGVTYYFAASSYQINDGLYNVSSLSPEISGVAGSLLSAAATLTSALESPAGQFGFTISGLGGGQYIVQASTDLVNWTDLQTNIAPFNFVDSNASQFSHRFYRTAYQSSN